MAIPVVSAAVDSYELYVTIRALFLNLLRAAAGHAALPS
eukprot:SAG31_NODE_1537_length_7982_cov_2.277813_4_plen_39_part_00